MHSIPSLHCIAIRSRIHQPCYFASIAGYRRLIRAHGFWNHSHHLGRQRLAGRFADALAGGATLLAHRLGWPEPNILQPWLGAAAVALFFGTAVVAIASLSSIVSGVVGSIRNARYEASRHDQRARELAVIEKDMFARLGMLQPFQKEHLREMLEKERNSLFVIQAGNGPSRSLLDAGFIREQELKLEGSICRFNPLLEFHRQKVLEFLAR